MKVTPLDISDVLLIEPTVYGDERGFFFESFNQARFNTAVGRDVSFVQDNHSKSAQGVLRGLHYQINHPQGKLLRVVEGEVFDVVVDLRKSSPTFGKWIGEILSADNKRQLWVPPGFAHGFFVLSQTAQFLYKTTDFYSPESERSVLWSDAVLNIRWPMDCAPVLSPKDAAASSFEAAELFD
jgi:dTDP-4-dehydrorhamnose 3,5-epimerase